MTVRHPSSVGVVGAGIVGLAVARELSVRYPGIAVTVFEKEDRVAAHQSGHNSGVVHAGVYYKPGSLKAELCRRGATLLREFCAEHGVPYRELGKLIVASRVGELAELAQIEDRARRNGVPGIRRLDGTAIAEIEPYAAGVAAIHSPATAVVDYIGVCDALGDEVRRAGGRVLLGTPVTKVSEVAAGVRVLANDEEHTFDQVIGCAGLHTDQLARSVGQLADMRITPFRGEYHALRRGRAPRPRDDLSGARSALSVPRRALHP